MALFSPSPEKEQTPTSPGCPHQGCIVDLLDDLGPGWDAGGGRRSPARGSMHRPRCCVSFAFSLKIRDDRGFQVNGTGFDNYLCFKV